MFGCIDIPVSSGGDIGLSSQPVFAYIDIPVWWGGDIGLSSQTRS